MELAGHIVCAKSVPPKSTRRRVTPKRQIESRPVPPDISQALFERLVDISEQLGSSAASIEAIREDLRVANADSKAYRQDISARLDNITIRVGKLEDQVSTTKKTVDDTIMPLINSDNERKLQIRGALRVWGVAIVVMGGLSAAFWEKLIKILVWVTGGGSPPA